jgi:signal transduction histidine kinase
LSGTNARAAVRRFRSHQEEVLSVTRKRVDQIRQRAVTSQKATVEKRNASLAEYGKKFGKTVSTIRQQHASVRYNLRRETVSKSVHVRVSRSLGALQDFVRVLKLANMTEQELIDAIHDPLMSGSSAERERRLSVYDLVQSMQKQLVQEHEFIDIAAHELRTPIMPILANAELLQDRIGDESSELKAIMRNALRLQRLAENVLSAARIDSESFKLNYVQFNINGLIAQIIREEEPTMRGREVRLVFIPEESDVTVNADENRMGQVLLNLLDNAIKFTKAGRILVRSERLGDSVAVSISDEGPGIDPQMFPLLFSKFASKSNKGTGLGLFISKKIVEAHGGKLEARNASIPGQGGAIFTFTLPLAPLS